MLASCFIFFFNDTATTEIYTLSLHDALPIFGTPCEWRLCDRHHGGRRRSATPRVRHAPDRGHGRSEEHTSELQSQSNLVCRLLLEKIAEVSTAAAGRPASFRHRSHATLYLAH